MPFELFRVVHNVAECKGPLLKPIKFHEHTCILPHRVCTLWSRTRPPACERRCGHCKNLAPAWGKAATALKGKFKIAAIDCTANAATCQV